MDPAGTGMIKGSEISVGTAVVCFLQLGLRYTVSVSVCVSGELRGGQPFFLKCSQAKE